MNTDANVKSSRSWVPIASILIIVNCLALIPSMGYEPLGAAIKKTITMSFTPWGLFAGMAGILAIVCAVPSGMAIKRFGARKVFLSGAVFMVAGLLMLSLSSSFSGAISGRGVWQIGIRFLLPSITAAIVVAVPDKYRSRVLGIGIAVSYLGTITAKPSVHGLARTGDGSWLFSFLPALYLFRPSYFFCFTGAMPPQRERP